MQCPAGHVLRSNVCVMPPVMSCPANYILEDGMCVPQASPSPQPQPQMMMSPSPQPQPQPQPQAAVMNTCPSGYTFSATDNMCYPLKN